jgi:hypothetical protein
MRDQHSFTMFSHLTDLSWKNLSLRALHTHHKMVAIPPYGRPGAMNLCQRESQVGRGSKQIILQILSVTRQEEKICDVLSVCKPQRWQAFKVVPILLCLRSLVIRPSRLQSHKKIWTFKGIFNNHIFLSIGSLSISMLDLMIFSYACCTENTPFQP